MRRQRSARYSKQAPSCAASQPGGGLSGWPGQGQQTQSSPAGEFRPPPPKGAALLQAYPRAQRLQQLRSMRRCRPFFRPVQHVAGPVLPDVVQRAADELTAVLDDKVRRLDRLLRIQACRRHSSDRKPGHQAVARQHGISKKRRKRQGIQARPRRAGVCAGSSSVTASTSQCHKRWLNSQTPRATLLLLRLTPACDFAPPELEPLGPARQHLPLGRLHHHAVLCAARPCCNTTTPTPSAMHQQQQHGPTRS